MATDELAAKLKRREDRIVADEEGQKIEAPCMQIHNVYTEFKEFSRKQIQMYQKKFNEYDVGRDKFIDLAELKLMMEKLGAPQTHLGLKAMIQEVDEDQDGKISFREFLLIFRKAAAGELTLNDGLMEIYNQISEIDVDAVGVGGAKTFFEAKIDQQTKSNQFEEEIRQEQEEKRQDEEMKKQRRAEFKAKQNMWN